MAAAFFQGTLGSFMSYSAFGGGNNGYGADGRPPGSWGSVADGRNESRERAGEKNSRHKSEICSGRVSSDSPPAANDAIKRAPSISRKDSPR